VGSLRDCTWILGLAEYRVTGLDRQEDGRLVIELEFLLVPQGGPELTHRVRSAELVKYRYESQEMLVTGLDKAPYLSDLDGKRLSFEIPYAMQLWSDRWRYIVQLVVNGRVFSGEADEARGVSINLTM